MTLATGSAFMHMSHTWTGGTYDNGMIAVIVYVAYQAIMEKLGTDNEFMLRLEDVPRIDAKQLSYIIAHMPLSSEAHQWYSLFHAYDNLFPHDYYKTFGALWTLVYAVTLPEWLSKKLLLWITEVINLK